MGESVRLLMMPSDVARTAGVTGQTVIGWQNRGLITPAFTTPNGTRLFDPEAIKRFVAQRKRRQQKKR